MQFTKPERYMNRVFVHCSASDNPDHDDIEVMRRWHVEENGWSDVGYHYFIRKSGRVEAGRSLERIPAAQGGHNPGTIAICLHGLKIEKFSVRQFKALSRLCMEINETYEHQLTFHGHCEVSNKSCPVFDYGRVLGLDDSGLMVRAHDTARQSPQAMTETFPVLQRTDSGAAVALLQERLNKNSAKLVVDGIFGRGTHEAVLKFQSRHSLVADGIVGPVTWETLA